MLWWRKMVGKKHTHTHTQKKTGANLGKKWYKEILGFIGKKFPHKNTSAYHQSSMCPMGRFLAKLSLKQILEAEKSTFQLGRFETYRYLWFKVTIYRKGPFPFSGTFVPVNNFQRAVSSSREPFPLLYWPLKEPLRSSWIIFLLGWFLTKKSREAIICLQHQLGTSKRRISMEPKQKNLKKTFLLQFVFHSGWILCT